MEASMQNRNRDANIDADPSTVHKSSPVSGSLTLPDAVLWTPLDSSFSSSSSSSAVSSSSLVSSTSMPALHPLPSDSVSDPLPHGNHLAHHHSAIGPGDQHHVNTNGSASSSSPRAPTRKHGMPDRPACSQPSPRPPHLQHNVDYLSYPWTETDLKSSWSLITKRKKTFMDGIRLENASWRRWMQEKLKLGKIKPEMLRWKKEEDITWLYGPFCRGFDVTVSPLLPDTASSGTVANSANYEALSSHSQPHPHYHSPQQHPLHHRERRHPSADQSGGVPTMEGLATERSLRVSRSLALESAHRNSSVEPGSGTVPVADSMDWDPNWAIKVRHNRSESSPASLPDGHWVSLADQQSVPSSIAPETGAHQLATEDPPPPATNAIAHGHTVLGSLASSCTGFKLKPVLKRSEKAISHDLKKFQREAARRLAAKFPHVMEDQQSQTGMAAPVVLTRRSLTPSPRLMGSTGQDRSLIKSISESDLYIAHLTRQVYLSRQETHLLLQMDHGPVAVPVQEVGTDAPSTGPSQEEVSGIAMESTMDGLKRGKLRFSSEVEVLEFRSVDPRFGEPPAFQTAQARKARPPKSTVPATPSSKSAVDRHCYPLGGAERLLVGDGRHACTDTTVSTGNRTVGTNQDPERTLALEAEGTVTDLPPDAPAVQDRTWFETLYEWGSAATMLVKYGAFF